MFELYRNWSGISNNVRYEEKESLSRCHAVKRANSAENDILIRLKRSTTNNNKIKNSNKERFSEKKNPFLYTKLSRPELVDVLHTPYTVNRFGQRHFPVSASPSPGQLYFLGRLLGKKKPSIRTLGQLPQSVKKKSGTSFRLAHPF